MSEFKYAGCVLDESGTDKSECHMKVPNGRKVAGAIRSLANARGLQLDWAMELHVYLAVYREKERSRIRAVQMDDLKGLLGIKRMHKVLNAQMREL